MFLQPAHRTVKGKHSATPADITEQQQQQCTTQKAQQQQHSASSSSACKLMKNS